MLAAQAPDGDVCLDVVGVLMIRRPPRLPVGGDTEPEAVGIDLLAHYCEPPFLVAADLLPWARRERVDSPARWSRGGRLSTITVTWVVRLRIR